MLGPMPRNDEVTRVLGSDYGEVLWEPGPEVIDQARITQYLRWLAEHRGVAVADYQDLWEWSVGEPGAFWDSLWEYFGVLGQRGDGPALTGQLPQPTWFPGATLNYARNALRTARTDPGRVAIIACAEDAPPRTYNYGALAAEVVRVRGALRALGVGQGDRVAAFLPNVPEALIGLLATASLGAIWSSCSPDFGAHSVIDRFAQIRPAVLFAAGRYRYGGKEFSRDEAVSEIVTGLPGLAALIMVDGPDADSPGAASADAGPADAGRGDAGLAGPGPAPRAAAGRAGVRTFSWADLPAAAGDGQPEFVEVPFDHPLWVLYSSGTTGLPKAIMHGHGGIVLEHLKALGLQQDLGPADVFFWYTTTGWMMWNYLAGGLLAGTTVVLYDGSATYPGTDALWRLAEQTGVTYFGTGAPYLLACAKAGLAPGRDLDLPAPPGPPVPRCRPRASTGSTPASARMRSSGRSPAVPTCAPGSSGPARYCRSGPASSPAAAWAPAWKRSTRPGSRSRGRSASSSSPRRCRPCQSASGTTRTARNTSPVTLPPILECGGTVTGSPCCRTADA